MMDSAVVAAARPKSRRLPALRRQALWVALTFALGLPAAQAQVHPDGSTSTTTDTAANGVPIVNIAAPNASGLSHNRYQQFDVASQGLILNNSGAITSTQLAGYVNGNPNLLPGQAATLILNEVTSALPSHLDGVTEVAGPAAQVVIANPNGIECSGCGFINTPRGMLTTGTPILDSHGALSGLRVSGGSITINGAGLDGSNIDRLDLVARALAVNAGVWAKQLNVVTGANQVDYGTLTPHTITGTGTAPAVALDVAALGGMYAGVIRLVATEAGVGVNNRGQLAAQAGDFTLSSAGQVVLGGKTSATGNLTISATHSLTNAGTLAAGSAMTLATGDAANGGTLYSGGPLTVDASGQLSNSGVIQAQNGALALHADGALSNASGASILGNGSIELRAASLDNAGKLYALGGGWAATIGGAINNQVNGDIYGSQGLALTAASLVNAGAIEAKQDAAVTVSGSLANSGHLQADQDDIALVAGALDSSGAISAQCDLQAQVTGVARNSGTLVSGGTATLSADSIENAAGGQMQSGTDLTLSAVTLDNAGRLHAMGDAVLGGGNFDNASTGLLLADGALTLNNAGNIANAGDLQAGGDLMLGHATSLTNANDATIYAGHDLGLGLAQALSNGGLAFGAHAVNLAAGSVSNAGTLRSGGTLSLDSTGDLDSTGAIQAQQDLLLANGSAFSNDGKLYAVGGSIDVQAGGVFTSGTLGDIYSGQNVTITAQGVANAGLLEAGQAISLHADGDASNSGTVQADQGDLAIGGATLTNQGLLSATGDTQLAGAIQLNNLGQVVTAQALTLTSASLRNSGQTQSGADTALQAAALDNSGRIQAGGTLAVSGNRTLTNQAAGQLLAAGDIDADTALQLSNAGVIQAGGHLAVHGAGAIDNQSTGTLYGTRTTLQLGGRLDNAGTVYGAQNLVLASGALANDGSLRSDAGLQLDVQGDASSSGIAYAAGDALWNVRGALANAGTLAAAGDITVTAGSLAGAGTLAAGLQGDGTLGTAGTLRVSTDGLLASSGRALAGGDLLLQGSAIDLSGSQARAGADATLTATQGNLSNQGGDLAANGTLTLNTSGALLNGGAAAAQGGRIDAQRLVVQAASLDNRYGTLTQGSDADLILSFAGGLANAHGTLASNANNLTISAASLDNSGGAIQHAGIGVLSLSTGGDLTNSGGQVAGNGALAIQSGGALGNAGGHLGVAGNAAVRAASLDNSHGTFAAAQVGLDLGQALTNIGGTVQASDGMTVTAGTLDNTGGYLKGMGSQALSVTTSGALTNASSGGTGGFLGGNGGVLVHAGSLRNAGQIYAGGALTVASQGSVVNDNGALQAMASLDVSAVSSLSNHSGRIEAGAGDGAAMLALHAGSLDNSDGRLANAGQGTSTISASGSIVNRGGTLGGQGNTALAAASLDNSQAGQVVAGQSLTLGLGGLNNAAGTLYAAANLAWSNASAHLANAGGNLGAGGSLGLGLQSIDNSGGAIAAGSNVNLELASFTGAGRTVAGQDLSLTLASGYTNGGGNTLKANRDLTLNLGGNFSNAGGATLSAVRNLKVTASNIDNAAGADINSAGTTLNARSGLTNAGRIEGDAITLEAGNLANTGTIIGGSIGVTASNLTNGSDLGGATNNAAYQDALVAATDGIDLFVSGTLLNRDATIFTLGNLRIGANASGGRSAAVINRSGDIEADGSVSLNASQFTNERRVINTSTYTLSAGEQAGNTTTSTTPFDWTTDPIAVAWCANYAATTGANGHAVRCGPMGYYGDSGYKTLTDQVLAVNRLATASEQSKLLASGDITLNGSVLNSASTIAAGNNLIVNGLNGSGGAGSTGSETVRNIAWSPTASVQSTETRSVDGDYQGSRWYSNRESNQPPMIYWSGSSTNAIALDPAGGNGWITINPGAGLAATMSARNTVSITAHTISNTTVGADGQPVHAVIGLGQNGGGQAVNGSSAGTVGRVTGPGGGVGGVAIGDTPSASRGGALTPKGARSGSTGGVTTPVSPQVVTTLGGSHPTVALPQSGLYTVQTNPSSPYLIETDPRFTQYSQFISSDYMMGKLDVAPAEIGKRLGDGFYEQRSVLDQIASLTGRRFLDDNTDALSQYRSLMDAGVQAAQQFDLSVGIALTPAQMADLTQDMVWMVTATVDGQQVLVPVVYLSADHAKALAAGGATIAGKNVILTASGDITNNGAITASDGAQLTAANLLNSGTLSAGGQLSVSAAQDILNGGTINAGGNVSLVAGNDVLSGLNVATRLGAVDLTGPGGPVSTVALGHLQPGSIHAGGDLAVNAGRDLGLDAAPVTAGGNLSLSAGRDLTATATAISAGRDAQLLAGRDLQLNATAHTTGVSDARHTEIDSTHTVTDVSAGGNVVLAAGRDITSQAAHVTAGDQLGMSAGRDVRLAAVTDNTFVGTGVSGGKHFVSQTQSDDTVRGTSLAGAKGVVIAAGRDLTATAGSVASDKGNVTLAAGNDLQLEAGQETHSTATDTVTTKHGLLSSRTTTTHDATSDTVAIGTALSGSNITLSAGHDLTTRGAQVSASQDIGVSAGHDVLLGAAQDAHSEEHDRSTVKRGGGLGVLVGTSKGDLFTRTHTTQQDSSSDTATVGTLLSGDHVTVAAGHDLTTQAAQIAGTHDVVLAAGHNVTVGTADNTHSEEHSLKVNTYGAQRSGLHGMFGVAKAKQGARETDVTPTGSLIGSTDGAVTISAGQDVHITGSDVISQTGTAIVGQNVTIDAAVGTVDGHQSQSLHTGGLMAGLTGGAATAAEQAYASGQREGQSSDKRLKALYAAQAAYGAHDAYKGGSAGLASAGNGGGAQGAANSSGVSLRIGIGASSASAHSDTHDDVAYGSHLQSQGDITIAATNGDLNVVGSQISGNNVALAASHDLNLLSQAEQHTQSDHSANARGELGFSLGSQTGFYVTADGGKGVAHGNGTTYANSSVTAGDTLSLVAGNDATIRGAQAKGNTVLASIGGDLTLESQQATDDYASHYWQAGGTYVYGSGSEVHASAGKVDSTYTGVQQTSGIGAGSGGFQIHVGGTTDLTGAVIASTADATKNLLDTGTLSYRDLENQASYNAISAGISVGSSGSGTSASPTIGVPQFGDTSSTTRAGIAQGTITVRNGQADLGGLDRNPDIDAAGLKTIFDPQKVAEQQELGQVAGQVGMRAVGDIAAHEQTAAAADLAKARDTGDAVAEADAQRRLDAWSEGGSDKIILHGLVGAATAALGGGNALQGALGAGSSQAASGAMETYLRDQGIDPYSPEGRTYMQLASAAIGAAAGGGAGASTALTGDAFNRQLHPNEIKLITGELAAKYAADHPGVSEREAETILIKQSLRQVDDAWAAKLGPDDKDAKQWLTSNTPDWAKQAGYFTATSTERADPMIYGQYYDSEFHQQWNGVLSDLASSLTGDVDSPAEHGSHVNFSGYNDMANILRDQGTMESLERKVASGHGLTTDEVNTYAQLATLYPMLRTGALGPIGQLGTALRDQDGSAAASAIIGAIPGEAVVIDTGKLAEATDAAKLEEFLSAERAASEVPNAGGDANEAASVWTQRPIIRGNAIENSLALTEYSAENGWFQVGKTSNGYFPLVDFQQGNTLVSLKTVDTGGPSWLGRMESHIDDLAANGATVNDMPANMVLDLRVQPGGAQAASPLIQYGRERGVTVVVKEFP